MSDDPTTEAGQAAGTGAAGRRSEPPEDLAAIIRRAERLGIAAWRVETALGIGPRSRRELEGDRDELDHG
jgi:hypothetical protein